MTDIELLNVLNIMCKVICDPHENMKLPSQTIETSNIPSLRTNRALQSKKHKMDVHDNNANIPDYFRSSTNRAADKNVSNMIHNEFRNVFFSDLVCFEGTFSLQVKDVS